MTDKPSLLIAGDLSCEKLVKTRWPGARIVGAVRDLALVEYLISNLKVDAVVVDPKLSTKGETFNGWVNRFKAAFPETSLIVAEDIGNTPQLGTDAEQSTPKILTSQTVVVWSPKGGVGKTFLATNLACGAALATKGRAGLIDLDLYSGDVSVHLDLLEGPTITEILPVLSEIRPEGLEKYAQKHGPTGLNVICSPKRPELSDLVTPEHVKSILSLAEKRWGLLYVDTPPDITNDILGECIEVASKIVLVTTQDVPTVRQCKVAMEILNKLGIKEDVIAVVLNKASKDSLIPKDKVEEFLGVELTGVVPEDRKTVEKSVFEGKPIVLYSKSETSDAIWQIISKISPGLHCPRNQRKPAKRRRGLFW